MASRAEQAKYPCPCCGRLVFREAPGSYDICPICFWEDDAVQLRWPDWDAGANRPCLTEAQATYQEVGSMESRFVGNVRPANAHEPMDEGWRPIDPTLDHFEAKGTDGPWPSDLTDLYWWRPTFWRRDGRES